MPELRQNLATKEWVIIATERARRPEEFKAAASGLAVAPPERDDTCPFCPGNEETDLHVMQLPEQGPWRVRVVRNKYPALVADGERVRRVDGVHQQISGVGHHEVLVSSPRHDTCNALESAEQVCLLLEAFRRRGLALCQDPRVEHVIYFENHGERAGASLLHPHAQLLALPVVPYNVRIRAEEARRHFETTGRCAFCEMVEDEIRAEHRIVAETDGFAAFIPYAAFSPFHLWILPRHHESSFLMTTAAQMAELGAVLQTVLRKLHIGLNDPDYNYVIRSAPLREDRREHLHWYLAIIPHVSRSAGFELGTGMFINTALPEASAEFLRNVACR